MLHSKSKLRQLLCRSSPVMHPSCIEPDSQHKPLVSQLTSHFLNLQLAIMRAGPPLVFPKQFLPGTEKKEQQWKVGLAITVSVNQ